MSRRMPRRSRVYDCNYDKGESYYRPALDRLDRKYSGRPEPQTLEERAPLADEFLSRRSADDFGDLNAARRRADKVISEEGVFDSRGLVVANRGTRPMSVSFDADPAFADEVNASIRQLRINKKKMDASFNEENANNFDSNGALVPPSTLRQRRFLDNAAERIMDCVGESMDSSKLSSNTTTVKRRVLKVTSSAEKSSDVTESGAKWSALRTTEDEGSAAAIRARQSRAMLADIEQDLSMAAERQAAREKRLVGLRALMAENERDDQQYHATLNSRKQNLKALAF